ncbi:glycosyltransferase family 4 protein [Flavobacterium ustbae]|uniref:glycosyltransferase family 4 protein n=1 Tax=Flavobacterium ustbae TaxID=2488790 RepID=UPI000F771998|nr:glycosyltransferase family 4 protein [Flavobacterium ustbae]
MKIGILVYRMSNVGGVQRITAEKINSWIEMFGYEVVLITKNEIEGPFFYDINPKCKRYNLSMPAKLSGGVKQYIKNIPQGFKFFLKLKKIIESEKIDVLFTNMIGVDMLAVPFVKTGVPKIHEIHGSGFVHNKKAWIWKSLIVNRYEKFVVLNENEIDYYPLNNIAVIPNFIYSSDYNYSRQDKKNIIITAGRISKEKQFDHLVDIWSIIASKYDQWEVHFYGAGITKALEEKIHAMGLQQSFKIFPSTTEIISKMQEASIFALVSATEAFPMVLLEAINAKLPIVSYDSPHGPKSIITDGKDGFIVPLNDKTAFAEKLELLINDELLRENFIENQKIKLAVFSKKRVMTQWNDLVLEVLSKKK